MTLLHIVHGAPGGIGRVEQLLGAVWSGQEAFDVKTVRKMSYPTYFGLGEPAVPATVGTVRWVGRILAAFVTGRPDLVLFNHVNFVPLALLFRLMRPSSRLAVLAYGVEAWKKPTILRRLGLRLVDQVWSISEYTANRLSATCHIARDRMAVVPLALLPEQARALALRLEGDANRGEILTVSRLWEQEDKGIDHLIQALRLIGPGIHLVIVGDGADRCRLEQLAQDLGVRSKVEFKGFTEDQALVTLYRRCELFALPSLQEGFGLVFLEAMTAGKPVVAARAGAAPEVVRDGVSGVLVPFGDPVALADAIQSLLSDSTRSDELGRRGRELAQTEFAYDRFRLQVMQLLLSLGGSVRAKLA